MSSGEFTGIGRYALGVLGRPSFVLTGKPKVDKR
jgi:hypothetical protein